MVHGYNGEDGDFELAVFYNETFCPGLFEIEPVTPNSVTSGNTSTSDETIPAVVVDCGKVPLTAGTKVRWYPFAGAELKTITASTCPNYGGRSATFDTRISIFSEDGSCVGGNNNEPNCGQDFRSKFKWNSVAGMDYYIMMHEIEGGRWRF
jgi:hypothetical protein